MTGDALLRAIIEDPSDDSARLVYADWLEEQGGVDHAEFIRVQVELEPLRGIAVGTEQLLLRRALLERERELLDKNVMLWMDETDDLGAIGHVSVGLTRPFEEHHGGWLSAVSQNIIEADFICGFVSRIQLKAADFMQHAEEIFSIQPVITEVRLTDIRPHATVIETTGKRTWAYWSASTVPYTLPLELFDLMLEEKRPWAVPRHMIDVVNYPSEHEAIEALSRAAVAHGRSLSTQANPMR